MSAPRRRMALACLVVGSLVAAGCVGNAAEPVGDSRPVEADALVEGRVVSDEIFPVAGAVVRAEGGEPAASITLPSLASEPGRFYEPGSPGT